MDRVSAASPLCDNIDVAWKGDIYMKYSTSFMNGILKKVLQPAHQ